MLTGEPPFTGPTAQAIVAKVMTEEPASIILRRKTVPSHGRAGGLHRPAEAAGRSLGQREGVFATRWTGRACRRRGSCPARVALPRHVLTAAAAGAARGCCLPLRRSRRGAGSGSPPRRRSRSRATRCGCPTSRADAFPTAEGHWRSRPTVPRSPTSDGRIRASGPSGYATRASLEAQELAGTELADAPFFSPDGRWIAYFVNGTGVQGPG